MIDHKNYKLESSNSKKDQEAKDVHRDKLVANSTQIEKNIPNVEMKTSEVENKKLKRLSPKEYLLPSQKDSIEINKNEAKIKSNKEKIASKEHIGYEVWKEKDSHKQSPKQKIASLDNPIEIIKDMKKNKDKIKDILSKSKTKRHSIWSEHNDSQNSFDSNGWFINRQNSSFNFFNHNKLGIPSTDHSLNSIVASHGPHRSDKSIKNAILAEQSAKINSAKQAQPDLQKEIEYEPGKAKEGKLPLVEIIKPNLHEKSKSVSTKAQEVDVTDKVRDSHSFAHDKSNNNERSLVDYLNERFEKEIGNKSNERSKANNDYLSPEGSNNPTESKEPNKSACSSYSPEIPREAIDREFSDLDKSGNTRHISLKNFDPEPNQKSGYDDPNLQSKWLENYLKKESNKSETNSHDVSEPVFDDQCEMNKLTHEEISRNQTPEGIDDASLAGKINPSQSQKKEENTTPREPK